MCARGAMRLVLVAGLLVSSGLCQNAEPGRRFHDSRNSSDTTDVERQRDNFWDAPPEGTARTNPRETTVARSFLERRRPSKSDDRKDSHGTKHSSRLDRLGDSTAQPDRSDSSIIQGVCSGSGCQLQGEGRRRKRRRGKQSWKPDSSERENLVNIGGRNRAKKRLRLGRLRELREEQRRRRRNRKRARISRLRLENRREEYKWDDNPIATLLRVLNQRKMRDEARFLIENPLNLSSTRFNEDAGSSKLLDASNSTSSSNYPSQLTTEPRIPEPPEPTSRYRVLPGEVEREFSRHMERELSLAQLAEKAKMREELENEDDDEDEDDVEEMDEELPRFDEQTVKRPEEVPKPPFDPERMLGYSRTDEDLPILDMENEVLQRTLKDYNAYMSSSVVKAAKTDKIKTNQHSNNRKPEPNESSSSSASSSSTESNVYLTDDDDLPGDLSCINGTFLPAPFIRNAVIKYVKSSRPGHEYLEADYKCEPGYAMVGASGNRLLCRERRWIGRLPVCRFHSDDETTCAQLGCEQLCKIVNGRAACLCREGFRLEGHKCIDIDECEANKGRGPCEGTCRNLPGGYACSCEDRPGTALGPDNRTCQTAGGSPCTYNNAGCSHTCLASMGRVFCLCPDGFMLKDDWKTCQDVDECAVPDLQMEVCRYGCINTPGSYRCVPAPEEQQHALDLLQGLQRKTGECQPGYEVSAGKSCVDINECARNNGGCSEVCENTEGSYFCACEGDERILSLDRKTCVVAEKRFESMDRESAALSLRFREAGDISCSPLNPAGRGYLICSDSEPSTTTTKDAGVRRKASDEQDDDESEEEEQEVEEEEDEEREPIRPGTKCHLKCPHGYELHGEYELTCRADGTWDGPKHGECLRYSKPRLDCPKDVVAELPPGRDEAFVNYDQPSTDLDWFRYVHSKPSWGTRLEANLKQGLHEITFYARHPVSKKQTSCTLKINVEEGQAPKVKGCPSDIEVTGKNGSAITWVEPVFTDNVKVTRITSNENPGNTFSLGGHKVEYEASDEAGWTTKCIFTVVLRPVAK